MESVNAVSTVWQVIAAAAIFLVVYAFVVTEKVNRAIAALAGALLLIVLGIVDFDKALQQYIPLEAIFLMAGMMILAGLMNKTGIIPCAAVFLVRKVKADPMKTLLVLSAITAAGSAFLDSIITVMLMVPLTFSIARTLKLNPAPFFISQIIAANIGGAATFIGNPSNMIIGTAADLSFNDFIIHLAPVAAISMIAAFVIFSLMYRNQMIVSSKLRAQVMELKPADYLKDRSMTMKSSVVYVLILIGFFMHDALNIEAAVVALAGATLLMLISLKTYEQHGRMFESVEWATIIFLAGLFVVAGGLAETGIAGSLATKMVEIAHGDMLFASMLLLWLTGIVSATADSLPFVAAMIPIIHEAGAQMNQGNAAGITPLWWSMALGASLGGNGTLAGAAVNVVVAGMSGKEGYPIRYTQFLKIGALVAIISLVISTLYIRFVFF